MFHSDSLSLAAEFSLLHYIPVMLGLNVTKMHAAFCFCFPPSFPVVLYRLLTVLKYFKICFMHSSQCLNLSCLYLILAWCPLCIHVHTHMHMCTFMCLWACMCAHSCVVDVRGCWFCFSFSSSVSELFSLFIMVFLHTK